MIYYFHLIQFQEPLQNDPFMQKLCLYLLYYLEVGASWCNIQFKNYINKISYHYWCYRMCR